MIVIDDNGSKCIVFNQSGNCSLKIYMLKRSHVVLSRKGLVKAKIVSWKYIWKKSNIVL